MKKLIALFLLCYTMPANAELAYNTYIGTGAYPNTPFYGAGTLDYSTALSTGTVPSINHNWASGNVLNSERSERVIVNYWGNIYIPVDGYSQTLTFYNYSDDGFYMTINNTVVINDWQEQSGTLYNGSGSITLLGGQYYAIEIWYYENGGNAAAGLYWIHTGGSCWPFCWLNSVVIVPESAYSTTSSISPYSSGSSAGGSTSANAGSYTITPSVTISTNKYDKINQTNDIPQSSIYIDSTGSYNIFNIEQFSKLNQIRGVNGAPAMTVTGNNNNVTINQGTNTTPIGKNLAEVLVVGNNNTLSLTQQHNFKYAEIIASGNNNQITAEQKNVGGKSLFFNILGNSNVITTLQQGAGNHYIDITAPYGSASTVITQSGDFTKQFQLVLNNPGIGVTVSQNNLTAADSAKMEITCTTGSCNGYTYTKN